MQLHSWLLNQEVVVGTAHYVSSTVRRNGYNTITSLYYYFCARQWDASYLVVNFKTTKTQKSDTWNR